MPSAPRPRRRRWTASGMVPPDLPELEWGEVMGPIEVDAYDRIATTLELALAAGRPEARAGAAGDRPSSG